MTCSATTDQNIQLPQRIKYSEGKLMSNQGNHSTVGESKIVPMKLKGQWENLTQYYVKVQTVTEKGTELDGWTEETMLRVSFREFQ